MIIMVNIMIREKKKPGGKRGVSEEALRIPRGKEKKGAPFDTGNEFGFGHCPTRGRELLQLWRDAGKKEREKPLDSADTGKPKEKKPEGAEVVDKPSRLHASDEMIPASEYLRQNSGYRLPVNDSAEPKEGKGDKKPKKGSS